MALALFHKGKPMRGIYVLAFHFDPPDIQDDRETDWKEDTSAEAVPTLQYDHVGVRTLTFTLKFNDFALGRSRQGGPGVLTTESAIKWLRQRQQANPPLWETPPVLVFTGAKPDRGKGSLFTGVITSTKVKRQILMSPAVKARKGLLANNGVGADATQAFRAGVGAGVQPTGTVPTGADLGDTVRAVVEVTMKENFDVNDQGTPGTLSEAFLFGVREGVRREGQ